MLRHHFCPFVAVFASLMIVPVPTAWGSSGISAAVDISLHNDAYVVGQFVSAEGVPVAGTEVRMTLTDGRTATTKTDAQGGFAFRGVTGAAYLTAHNAEQVVRVWDAKTAPPKAAPAVLMVQHNEVARGQHYAGQNANNFINTSKRLMANPLFVAGAVATAVAIPVAIHNADDEDPASP
jgi:hypothetical protein